MSIISTFDATVNSLFSGDALNILPGEVYNFQIVFSDNDYPEDIMIPDTEECILLMNTYGMLDNIRAHSFKVEQVARIMANGFEQKEGLVHELL